MNFTTHKQLVGSYGELNCAIYNGFTTDDYITFVNWMTENNLKWGKDVYIINVKTRKAYAFTNAADFVAFKLKFGL